MPPKYSLHKFPDYSYIINNKKIHFNIHIDIHINNIEKYWKYSSKYIWSQINDITQKDINIITQLQMVFYEILNKEENTDEQIIRKTQKQIDDEFDEIKKEKKMKIEILSFLMNIIHFIIDDNISFHCKIKILYKKFLFIFKKFFHLNKNEYNYQNIFYNEMDLFIKTFIVSDDKKDIEYSLETEINKNTDITEENIIQSKRNRKKTIHYGYFRSDTETENLIKEQEFKESLQELQKQKKTIHVKKQIKLIKKKLDKIKKNDKSISILEIKSDDKITQIENDLQHLYKQLKNNTNKEEISIIKSSINSKLKSLKKENDKLYLKNKHKNLSSIKNTLSKLEKYKTKFKDLNLSEIESESEDDYFSENSELSDISSI